MVAEPHLSACRAPGVWAVSGRGSQWAPGLGCLPCVLFAVSDPNPTLGIIGFLFPFGFLDAFDLAPAWSTCTSNLSRTQVDSSTCLVTSVAWNLFVARLTLLTPLAATPPSRFPPWAPSSLTWTRAAFLVWNTLPWCSDLLVIKQSERESSFRPRSASLQTVSAFLNSVS